MSGDHVGIFHIAVAVSIRKRGSRCQTVRVNECTCIYHEYRSCTERSTTESPGRRGAITYLAGHQRGVSIVLAIPQIRDRTKKREVSFSTYFSTYGQEFQRANAMNVPATLRFMFQCSMRKPPQASSLPVIEQRSDPYATQDGRRDLLMVEP